MIIFKNVSKKYRKDIFAKGKPAVHGLSFALKQNSTLGLIGANGAGKTTSIRLLMGFISLDAGLIEIYNGTPSEFSLRKKIGYLPETANFPPNLNILNLLKFTAVTCRISSKELKCRGEKWLNELDLWKVRKRPLKTYSKGMQQRANFVLALINNPALLILDEPMSGLDPMGRDKIIKLIIDLKHEGKSILFCSHILDDVDRVADNILLLHKGRKIFYGRPETLAAQENKNSLTDAFVSIVKKEDPHG